MSWNAPENKMLKYCNQPHSYKQPTINFNTERMNVKGAQYRCSPMSPVLVKYARVFLIYVSKHFCLAQPYIVRWSPDTLFCGILEIWYSSRPELLRGLWTPPTYGATSYHQQKLVPKFNSPSDRARFERRADFTRHWNRPPAPTPGSRN